MVPDLMIMGHPRKETLVDLGLWAVTTGRGWIVRAVHAALEREGLIDA